MAAVVLPNLSKQFAKSSNEKFSIVLDWSIRWVLLVGIPSSIGLVFLAGPLLITLFQSGQFLEYDVLMTRISLVAYSVAIAGMMLIKVLSSAFFAKQDVKRPLIASVIILILNIIFNSLFIGSLAHIGLALATSISSILHVFILFFMLYKQKGYYMQAGWFQFLVRIFCSSLILLCLLNFIVPDLSEWFLFKPYYRVCFLLFVVVCGIFVYSLSLLLVGFRFKNLYFE